MTDSPSIRFLGLTALLLASPLHSHAQTPPAFDRDVRPIFARLCAGCHFPEALELQSDLNLSTLGGVRMGGKGGAAIEPGDAEASRLFLMISGRASPRMPPQGNARPIPEEIELVRRWIEAGAPGGDESRADVTPTPAPTETIISERAGRTDRAAPIASLSFSPDGGMFARGRLREVELMEPDGDAWTMTATLEGHAEMVRALAFSPDGARLAAAGGLPARSGEIVIWSLADRSRELTIEGHRDNILDVAFSPDGRRLASASYDKSAILWDAESGERIDELRDHVDAVYALAFSPDGERLATASGDRTVKVWDVATGERVATLSDSTDAVLSVAFSPSGDRLAAGSADKVIRLWDAGRGGRSFTQTNLRAGELLRSTFAHEGAVLALTFTPDGAGLVSSGEDRRLKLWSVETLTDRRVFEEQSDWAAALAIDPRRNRLAVGRHDASVTIYNLETGEPLWSDAPAPPVSQGGIAQVMPRPPEPKKANDLAVGTIEIRAVVPPTIRSVEPRWHHRGTTVTLTVRGTNFIDPEPHFTEPRLTAVVTANKELPKPPHQRNPLNTDAEIADNARPHELTLIATIPPDAPLGRHELRLRTANGMSNHGEFNVIGEPDAPEVEINNSPAEAQTIEPPTTIFGVLYIPEDVDVYKFHVEAGRELSFAIPLAPRGLVARLLDANGRELATSEEFEPHPDMVLGRRFDAAGDYYLELRDLERRSGLGYRLYAGEAPIVTDLFPLGVRAGAASTVRIEGFGLGGREHLTVQAPEDFSYNDRLSLPIDAEEGSPLALPKLAIGDAPESTEAEPNDRASEAKLVNWPATINGRIDGPGDADLFRFRAEPGRTLVIEVEAARPGSQLDSVVEVLDIEGRPLRRARLRCVAQTRLTLADKNAFDSGMRLEDWSDLAIGDYVLIGSEVLRVVELPDYPDEDVRFASYFLGQRRGEFGTTPGFRAIGTPVYKIEVLPPDERPAPNGMPIFDLDWRNDDRYFEGAPPGDSLLVFEAPESGEYIVKVRDALGRGGRRFAYRLMLREPAADFDIAMSPERPNIAPGGRIPISVRARRRDGFEGPVRVRVEGLPPGFAAPEAEIGEGQLVVDLPLTATADAASTPWGTNFRVVAETTIGGRRIERTTEMGPISVTARPADVIIQADRRRLVVRPGEWVELEARVERFNEFDSRVPVDVVNLPFGARVMDTGLNGILVRVGETRRTMKIYVEPWVKPMRRTIYLRARIENRSTQGMLYLSEAVELVVEDGIKDEG